MNYPFIKDNKVICNIEFKKVITNGNAFSFLDIIFNDKKEFMNNLEIYGKGLIEYCKSNHYEIIVSKDNNKYKLLNMVLTKMGFHTYSFFFFDLVNFKYEPENNLIFKSLNEVGENLFKETLEKATMGDPNYNGQYDEINERFNRLKKNAGEYFNDKNWLLAYENDNIIGIILPQRFPNLPENGANFYLGLLTNYRGKNYGSSLLHKGMSSLIKQRVKLYTGKTSTKNVSMEKLFLKNGFISVEETLYMYDKS